MMTTSKPKLAVTIRWMIRSDMEQVLGIESANFEHAWDEAEFLYWLRNRNVIAFVAERGDRVCGFMVYELLPKSLSIVNLAVHASVHRQGVGTALVDKLKDKISKPPRKRSKLLTQVSERNLDGCLFFKSLGFQAVAVRKGFYEEMPEIDAIEFEYRLSKSPEFNP